MTEARKRGPGRPPLPAGPRQRVNLTLRIREKTKAKLRESAEENGRSLSEEAEYRLGVSFDNDSKCGVLERLDAIYDLIAHR